MRLYVGGLSHTVTQKDLKDRFGKFGDVEDVEIRTRRDNDGEDRHFESIGGNINSVLPLRSNRLTVGSYVINIHFKLFSEQKFSFHYQM